MKHYDESKIYAINEPLARKKNKMTKDEKLNTRSILYKFMQREGMAEQNILKVLDNVYPLSEETDEDIVTEKDVKELNIALNAVYELHRKIENAGTPSYLYDIIFIDDDKTNLQKSISDTTKYIDDQINELTRLKEQLNSEKFQEYFAQIDLARIARKDAGLDTTDEINEY